MDSRIENSPPWTGVLPWSLLVMLALLLVQFVVGMFVNLFVGIPPGNPGATVVFVLGAVPGMAWAVRAGGPALAFHTVLGLLLAANAVLVLVLAIKSGQRPLIAGAIFGLLGIVGAGLAGIDFLNYLVDRATFLMSVGFSVAVGAYVFTLFTATRLVVSRPDEASRQAAG